MNEFEQEIWGFLDRHLKSIFSQDVDTYKATTADDLSLYEWFIAPHRMDGLDFHLFMIRNTWAGGGEVNYELLEPRIQRYGDTVVVSYTFLLSRATEEGIVHQMHNESRVLVKMDGDWKIVHVHKSPAGG